MTDPNTSDQDVTRAIRSWLHEDRHEDASRIAGAVLDQVDTIPQRRATWWPARRTSQMNKFVGFGLTAAAVVVVVLVGSQMFGPPAPGVGTAPSPSPEPSVSAPSAEPSPSASTGVEGPPAVPVGSHVVYEGDGDEPSITVTIPATGWYGDLGGDAGYGGQVNKDRDVPGEVAFGVWVVSHVYADACQSEGTLTEIGPGPEDLVTALLAQEDVAAEGPTDLTIDGYPAQRIDLAYPSGLDASACRHGPDLLQVWADQAETYFFVVGRGSNGSVYVVDVDGQRVVLSTDHADSAAAADIAEMEAVFASVQIGE